MIIPIEKKAIDILKIYKGTNNYILYLVNQYKKSKSFIPTKAQAEYILKNHNVLPVEVNKSFEIHIACRNYLQSQNGLNFLPERIYIQRLLTRNDDLLHVWGYFNDDSKYMEPIYISKECLRKVNKLPDLDFSKYEREPKEHQIEGIKALLSNDFFILADDMGLGKTVTTIIAALEGNFKKILIVCPASLKLNWKKEIMYYDSEDNISIVDGVDFRVKKWTIVNYDILRNFHKIPEKRKKNTPSEPLSPIDFHKFDLVIADEAHYLKNATSNRTKLFNDFAFKIPKRWFLTGTPLTNKPVDLYNLLLLCESPVAKNWVHYVRRYCAGKQFTRPGTKQKFWVTSGASNLDELKDYSAESILRRTKKDSINLPTKTIKPIYLGKELCLNYNIYLEEYEQWAEDMLAIGEKPTVTDHLTKLTKVRQLLSNDKIEHTISLAEDLIENGRKVIIFSCFTQTINYIHEHFGKSSVIVDGSVSSAKRQLAVEKFQNDDKIKVFCGNIIAAGVGLTLTEGSVVIFNDLDWTPANHAQAEDRAYRIGQVNDVHIIYPLFDDTLDTIMYDKLREKVKIINQVMGDSVLDEDNISLGREVIKSLTKF